MNFKSLTSLVNRKFANNTIRVFSITARTTEDKKGIYWKNVNEKSEHRLDSALDNLLASVAECEQASAKFWCMKLGIKLNGINYKKFEAKYDVQYFQGLKEGPSIFEEVNYELEFDCDADEAKLAELKSKVEKHCPAYNMIARSGVPFKGKWTKKSD